MWRNYTFNELQAGLKLLLQSGSHFTQDEDMNVVRETIALIDSLTREERLAPTLVLECRSRWTRALRGSGTRNVSRKAIQYWFTRMSAIINEVR